MKKDNNILSSVGSSYFYSVDSKSWDKFIGMVKSSDILSAVKKFCVSYDPNKNSYTNDERISIGQDLCKAVFEHGNKSHQDIAKAIGTKKSVVDAIVSCFFKKVEDADIGAVMRIASSLGVPATDVKECWLKGDTYSLRVVNNSGMVTYGDIRDEFIEQVKAYAPKYPTIKYPPKNKDKMCGVIDAGDIHVGKLAVEDETGNEYNIKIAVDRSNDGLIKLAGRENGNIDQWVLVVGNDVLHTELNSRATTKGTRQDTDGRWFQAYKAAQGMYIGMIERLVQSAPVHVIHCMSNHDYDTGWLLSDSIAGWFRNCKNVSFDTSRAYRKYYRYHNSMMMFTHGDTNTAKDLGRLMNAEMPKMYGECNHKNAYMHHFHSHKEVKQVVRDFVTGLDHLDVTIQWLRSPSGTDLWHKENGYTSKRGMSMFAHSKTDGQVTVHNIYF